MTRTRTSTAAPILRRRSSSAPGPRASTASSRSAPGSTLAARRSSWRSASRACSRRSESIRTRQGETRRGGWKSFASCSATSARSRDADEATAEALDGFDGTVILHCFSSPGLLPVALERSYYVSFAGNVTYPKAPELREAAARVPADRILAETDSPYLAPQPLRGRSNEPANVVHTIAALAEARGEDPAELAARIDANATAAFSLG